MSRLVSFYEDEPIKTKDGVEVEQFQMPAPGSVTTSDGGVRPHVVYVVVQNQLGPVLHVPFAAYDEWFLRDRYQEALRIVNTLGASRIECETSRNSKGWSGVSIGFKGFSAGGKKNRNQSNLYDFSHTGAGSRPRDPRPLKWPDEPGFGAAVSSVLDNRATRVTINISSTTRHSVEGSLGKKLHKLGFELGVTGETSEAVTLRMTAEFPERATWR